MASGYYDFSGAFGNLNQSLAGLGKQFDEDRKRQGLAGLGKKIQAGDLEGASQDAFALGDTTAGIGIMKLSQAAKDRASDAALVQGVFSGGAGQQPSPAAPVAIGNPTEVESRFIGGVKQAGLTNPVGLGAVAAYGRAESGFSPRNANRVWNDPSESGQAGQAGGIMSWRADRLRNLYSFAQERGEQPGNISPETQATFLAQEDPTLIPKLQAARTPEEANQIMANAWRFAGYNRPGGENARRLAMTQNYANRYGQQSDAQPVQMAQAPAQAGEPVSDAANVPSAQANNAAFYIPGTDIAAPARLENNRQIMGYAAALAAAKSDGAKAAIRQRLDIAMKDEERRYNEGKTPEAAREFQYARQQGWTKARTPVEYAGEKAAAQREEKDRAEPLRKEIQQLPSYKNLAQAAPIYRSMFETAGRNTKASDLNLVYGLGKIMDPTSVVREGEMIMVKNSAGLSEQLMGAVNALNGGAALTPETRQALMAEAYSRMNTYRDQFEQDASQYRGIVERRQLNPADVIPNIGDFRPYEGAKKPPPAAQPAPAVAGPEPQRVVAPQYVRPDGSSPPVPAAEPDRKLVAPKSAVRIQRGMTPEMIKQRFAPGTKLILPDGTEGVVK